MIITDSDSAFKVNYTGFVTKRLEFGILEAFHAEELNVIGFFTGNFVELNSFKVEAVIECSNVNALERRGEDYLFKL